MVRADKLAKSYPGKEHHVGFDDFIDHPDALFIAHAKQDIEFLLAEIDRLQAERGEAIANMKSIVDGDNYCKYCDKYAKCEDHDTLICGNFIWNRNWNRKGAGDERACARV